MAKLDWSVNKRKKICSTCVLDLFEEECVAPSGFKGNYVVMDARDWVVCIPVLKEMSPVATAPVNDTVTDVTEADYSKSKRRFIMVKQWRHGAKSTSIEFPGGVVNYEEKPEDAAVRELLEETGYKAGRICKLGTMNPNPAIMSNHVHFFAAFDLVDTGKRHLDEDEFVDVMIQDETEVIKKMGTPEYPHALMSAALALYIQHFLTIN